MQLYFNENQGFRYTILIRKRGEGRARVHQMQKGDPGRGDVLPLVREEAERREKACCQARQPSGNGIQARQDMDGHGDPWVRC